MASAAAFAAFTVYRRKSVMTKPNKPSVPDVQVNLRGDFAAQDVISRNTITALN